MVEKSHNAGLWPSLYDPFRQFATRMADWLSPATDAKASDEAYVITMELPGVEEKDIDVSVHEGVVTVKGEKTAEREEEGETWFFAERQFGSFSRSFRLPADADADKVSADLKDGILTLRIPKQAPQSAKGRKVKVSRA